MGAGPLVVTYPLTGRSRGIVEEELGGTAEAIYLIDLAPADRAGALGRAGAVLSHDTSKELRPDEIPLIRNARLLQFTAAGVDWVPTRDLPRELLIGPESKLVRRRNGARCNRCLYASVSARSAGATTICRNWAATRRSQPASPKRVLRASRGS